MQDTGGGRDGLELCLLGPLEVWARGEKVKLGGFRTEVVLATMALEPRHVVTVERLIDALYGDNPPRTARAQVQIVVSKLRKRLGSGSDNSVVFTQSGGYGASLSADQVDLQCFRRHVVRAREARKTSDLLTAVEAYRSGLGLWRGEALTGLPSILVENTAQRLNEERLSALEERIEVELSLGWYRSLVGELSELTALYPLRGNLHKQLALALHGSGRQVDALAAIRVFQRRMQDEYGLVASAQLAQLELAILEGEGGRREFGIALPYRSAAIENGFWIG